MVDNTHMSVVVVYTIKKNAVGAISNRPRASNRHPYKNIDTLKNTYDNYEKVS